MDLQPTTINGSTDPLASTVMAKLTNHKHYSLDSEDDFRSGCRKVNHPQQFFSELPSPDDHNTRMRSD